jgi:HK97 family phage prohead protease
LTPDGWRTDNYRKAGAPVLWAHDYKAPPIARSLQIRRTPTGLMSVDQFPPPGVYPFADQVHDLVAEGLIRAKSVGFIPIRKTWNAERSGWDIHEAELIEHSYVSIGSNPEALVRAQSKGIRDRAALDAFFRAPRGGDERLTFDEADLRAAVPLAFAREAQRHAQAREQITVPGDARDVRRWVHEALALVVGREARGAINALRGRVD